MPLARRILYEDDVICGHPIFGILVQVVNTQIRIQEMGQIHSAIRGIALAFLRMHHVGLVEVDGILGLDFGLTEWTDIPDYQGDNNSIEKLCEKLCVMVVRRLHRHTELAVGRRAKFRGGILSAPFASCSKIVTPQLRPR